MGVTSLNPHWCPLWEGSHGHHPPAPTLGHTLEGELMGVTLPHPQLDPPWEGSHGHHLPLVPTVGGCLSHHPPVSILVPPLGGLAGVSPPQ